MTSRISQLLPLALLGPALGLAYAQDPVGMVLRSGPGSTLTREGQQREVQMAELLYSGDQIEASDSKVTLLFCPSSEMLVLEPGTLIELAGEAAISVRGEAPSRQPRRCSLPKVALGAESLERVGGLRARGFAPIPLFLGGTVSMQRPVFEWDAVEEGSLYHLTVRNQVGALIWEGKTHSTMLAYPDSNPPLEPGDYRWEVNAEVEGKTVAQQLARFTIRPNADLCAKPPEGGAEILLCATELENAGYYAEAASCFRKLREQNPGDERLTRHLAWLYWNSGLIAAASLERKRFEQEQDQ